MSEQAARPKPAITRGEWGLLFLLCAVQFTNILDFVIIMPLAPLAKTGFGIDSERFGHVVAAYGFASFVSSILAARFLDRFDRKTALLSAYAGFAVGTLLCGLAPTYETLVAARAVAGFFGGVVGASVMAIVGDVFADYRRGTAMGAVMSSFALSSIVGLPIGLILAEFLGFGAPFIVLGAVSAAVCLGNYFVLPSMRAHLAHGHPPVSLWKLALTPNHLLAFMFSFTLVLGSFTIIPYLADSMVANAGQRFENMKYIYLIAGLFTLVSTNVVGRMADRYGKRLVFRVMGSSALVLVVAVTNLPVVSFWLALAAATAFMVATSGRMVPAQAIITGCAVPALRAGFLSLNSAVQAASMGIASLIGGALIGQTEDGRLAGYPVVGVIAMVSAALSLVLVGALRLADVPPVVVPAQSADA